MSNKYYLDIYINLVIFKNPRLKVTLSILKIQLIQDCIPDLYHHESYL